MATASGRQRGAGPWSTVTDGQRGRVDSRWSWRAAARDPEPSHRHHHRRAQPPRRPRQPDRQPPRPARRSPDHRPWWPARVRPMSAAAAAYCVEQGGQVQTRTADWGTNGDQQSWLALGGATDMCRFQAERRRRIAHLRRPQHPVLGASRPWRGWPTWRRSRWPPAPAERIPQRATARIWAGHRRSERAARPAADGCPPMIRSTRSSRCACSRTCPSSTNGGWPTTPTATSAGRTWPQLMKYQPGADVPPVFVEQTPTPTS